MNAKTYFYLLLSYLSCLNLTAQNPIWTLPSSYLFNDGINPNPPQPLPQPNSSGFVTPDLEYLGQQATNSHNAMVDQSGNLLFFHG